MNTTAIINIAKAQLDMAEDDYRAMLTRMTGCASLRVMTEAQKLTVIEELKRLGFQTALTGVVGTPQTLTAKTFVNGTFDAADVSIPAVTGVTAEALVIYIDTGTPGTSRLVCHLDTGVTGLPFTPNGGDANIVFNASGIFRLGA